MKIARIGVGVTVVGLFVTIAGPSALAQGRKEKKEARLAESEKPRDVPGGVSFAVNMPADKAFDVAVRYFQTHDAALDESSKKDLGQLTTAIRIVDVGGFRNNNKGYRTYVTFIRDSDTSTTVKVRVTVQQRTKHLQAEPWSDPKVLDKETAETADQLKAALTSQ
ncbi:MAG: hypothetical protein M1570_12300 [Chloroflexi bacterium]|nr:hypothetical protein [Chloroflexota bacterium]